MPDELEFIAELQTRFPPRPPVMTGIGDDGAVLDCSNATRQVVVTDMLLDGVHFNLKQTPPELVGRKSIAVNLSDLAAMACRPTAAFISIAVDSRQPPAVVNEFLHRLYAGIAEVAESFHVTIAGGDTNSWQAPFAINVCLTGQPFLGEPVLRSGGNAGDRLFVTGPLGGSLCSGRHLRFTPQLEVARWLVENVRPTAMMDISDGLGIDLSRLARQSSVSAVIEECAIPIHNDVPRDLPPEERIRAALSDGEDFELLFSVRPQDAVLLEDPDATAGFTFYPIGLLAVGEGCRCQRPDGTIRDVTASGWHHRL